MSRRSDKLARGLDALELKRQELAAARESASAALRDVADREAGLAALALAVELEETPASELEKERQAVARARARFRDELARIDLMLPALETRIGGARQALAEAEAEDAQRQYEAAREGSMKVSDSIASDLASIAAARPLLESAREETDAARERWIEARKRAGQDRPALEPGDDEAEWPTNVVDLLERGPRRPFERETAGRVRGLEQNRRQSRESAFWHLRLAAKDTREATRRELEAAVGAGDVEAADILRLVAVR